MRETMHFSTVGIIAEYNPFHNGHRYHIEQARKLTGADYVIAVMSGDFVQRGLPAIYDKYTRTAMALHSGADLVLEMPALFATSSAEDFSACGIALLDRLGVVDAVCFGSECGEIQPLLSVAHILAREPEPYTQLLRSYLREGPTFPEARARALLEYISEASEYTSEASDEIRPLLDSPNNILGIEYCKALIRRNSPMKPVTVMRAGKGYHDSDLGVREEEFSSASGIRHALETGEHPDQVHSQVPKAVLPLIQESPALFPSAFTAVLNAELLRLVERGDVLSDYADVSEELESRIRRMVLEYGSYEERAVQLKTRQYTHTRISRALLHLMLGMKKTDVDFYRQQDYVPYARVLGFKKESAPLLSRIKTAGGLPLITKTADAGQILSPDAYRLLKQDFYCSHLYHAVLSSHTGAPSLNEYNRPLVIL